MKKERVVISTHNPTMRTALRLVALTAPFWAIYVTGQFLGIFGFYLNPVFFDANSRIFWMLAAFAMGLSGSCLLLLNSLILSKAEIDFPPLKAARLPIGKINRVAWHWDPIEREAYMRFWIASDSLHSLENGLENDLESNLEKVADEYIDIHSSRLTSKNVARLRDALKEWSPQCAVEVHADDLEDTTAFRERFYRPRLLSLSETEGRQKAQSIDVPYHPHKQLDDFFQSLGANEKYFWYCWLTVLLVPCLLKLPDIVWGFIADYRQIERFADVPAIVQQFDLIASALWYGVASSLSGAGFLFMGATTQPLAICLLLGMAGLAAVALAMFVFQANGITLKPDGLELFFHWQKIVLFKTVHRWKDMVAFNLDQFGDVVNPEKWRMQIKMFDGSTVNLKIESIRGAEARETLLRTISQMAPDAVQDPALIRALMPAQKDSYTELWLQSLVTPPKRSRLAPLGQGQKLKAGRYLVEKQLAVGGQGVAYVATDVCASEPTFTGTPLRPAQVVLKEFVLPVYTSRVVRKQALERFENEARILRELEHPQIVKLIDYFLEDHRAYLVLEHIDGVSLRKLVQTSGPLSEELILDLSAQMCKVLEYLHSLSPPVVHRDFTPDNLILDRSGRLVLIDFNVAQQKQWTTTGTVVGKHAYLPPEQFRGQPSTQSDLYAMGATLFYLSTGKDPEPISCSHPARINETINAGFDSIVAGLTAVELGDRYLDVSLVWQDLQQLSSSMPGAAKLLEANPESSARGETLTFTSEKEKEKVTVAK